MYWKEEIIMYINNEILEQLYDIMFAGTKSFLNQVQMCHHPCDRTFNSNPGGSLHDLPPPNYRHVWHWTSQFLMLTVLRCALDHQVFESCRSVAGLHSHQCCCLHSHSPA